MPPCTYIPHRYLTNTAMETELRLRMQRASLLLALLVCNLIAMVGLYAQPHGKQSSSTVLDPHHVKGSSPQSETSEQDIPDSIRLYVRALKYVGIDDRKGRDTMRRYVEEHPFAMTGPGGYTCDGISSTAGFTSNIWKSLPNDSLIRTQVWIDEYNWLVKIQPINPMRRYQLEVVNELADAMGAIDLNESANLWYNYMVLFTDSTDIDYAWRMIQGIRGTQIDIPQDTTAWKILHFPLKPLGLASVHGGEKTPSSISVDLYPNPATRQTTLEYALPQRAGVSIGLFDVLGKEVRHVTEAIQDGGNYSVPLELDGLENGRYFVRFWIGGETITKSLLVNR